MGVHLSKGVTHVVEVDSDVPQCGLDVLVAVDLRDRLDRPVRILQVTAEGPPHGVV